MLHDMKWSWIGRAMGISPAADVKVRSISYSPSAVRLYLGRYRLTLEGWLTVTIMTMVGVAAWHSGTNLLYLMCSMLIGFLLTQSILIVVCLAGLKVRRMLPSHAYAGEETHYRVVVENGKRFAASYALRLVEQTSGHRVIARGYLARVARRASVEAEMIAHFPGRGLYTLSFLTLRTRYPFGLSERAQVFTQPGELIVYPPRVDVRAVPGLASADFGEEESRVKGAGAQLYGLAEYVQGTHARHIHWRSSAKTNKLMVIEHERDELLKATVILWNAEPAESMQRDSRIRSHFEQAVTFAAGLSRLLIGLGYEVDLVTSEGIVPPGTGAGHLDRILRTLALIELRPQSGSPTGQGSRRAGTDYSVVFSDFGLGRTSSQRTIDVRRLVVINNRFVPGDNP